MPGLLSSGADAVIADLEAQDYTCWPIVLGADNVGASHKRRRVFFIAMANSGGSRLEGQWGRTVDAGTAFTSPCCASINSFPAKPGDNQFKWEEPRTVESTMGSSVDGSSRRLARWRKGALKGLGNMVVPQVAKLIGEIILAIDTQSTR